MARKSGNRRPEELTNGDMQRMADEANQIVMCCGQEFVPDFRPMAEAYSDTLSPITSKENPRMVTLKNLFTWVAKRVAILLVIGLTVAYVPQYGPVVKAFTGHMLGQVTSYTLDRCSDLGRHIAEMIDAPENWTPSERGFFSHKKSELKTDGENVIVGEANITERLTDSDRAVIAKRVASLSGQFRKQEDERLVRQLAIQQKTGIDSKLARGLTTKE